MSLFGRAAAGIGAAAAQTANKYIDEAIQTERAQALADIAHANMVRGDEYNLSAPRQEKLRQNASDAALSQAAAARRGVVEGTTDTAYQSALDTNAERDTGRELTKQKTILQELTPARIAAEKAVLEGLTPAKIAAEKQTIEGTMGVKAKAAGLMARAQDMGGALRAAQTELVNMEVSDRKRLNTLYDEYLAITSDVKLTEQEKATKLVPIANAIQAVKAKSGKTTARDPELDTETITEEKLNPDGSVTKVQRKQVRRPGAGGGPQSPYPEGTRLQRDGVMYVVKDGVPVAEGAAQGGGGNDVPTRKDPITGRMLTEREWDKKFGRGDFRTQPKSLYAPGEDALKPF